MTNYDDNDDNDDGNNDDYDDDDDGNDKDDLIMAMTTFATHKYSISFVFLKDIWRLILKERTQ